MQVQAGTGIFGASYCEHDPNAMDKVFFEQLKLLPPPIIWMSDPYPGFPDRRDSFGY